MAIIDDGILKGCHGKVKDYIIYQYRGRTCLRAKPDREHTILPPEVLRQQERIAGVAALYRAVKSAGIADIWRQAVADTRLTGYNLFVQHNLPAFTGEGCIGDFNKMCLSTGTLPLPDRMRIVSGGANKWILEWHNMTLYPGVHADDRLVIALAGQENGFRVSIPDIGDFRREQCRAVIRLPAIQEGYNHLYGWFSNTKGNRFSESFYALLSN